MATNVPSITFGDTGVIVPSDQAILAGVIADLQAAFGGALNLSADDTATLSTPQGQLATSLAATISNVYAQFLYQSTQTDPAYARGRWQDAIGRIYFLERNPAQPTVAQCTCTGLAGVVIPEGSTAQAEDGNLYASTAVATIPVGGSISVPFACTAPGPTACPAGTLNRIYQAIPGWDTITNPTDGVVGNNTETRSAFEERRAQSVAQNASGQLPAVLGAVLAVPNVIDAYATENVNDTPTSVGGVTLAAHSLYVAAVGGAADEIARAIWTHKAPGCAYNGNTTVTVYDDSSGYSEPFPSYAVTFEIPSDLAVLFDVTISNSALVPADAATLVQNAIVSAFSGGDGGQRARIGTPVFASRFYSAVAVLGAWAQIISIKVGSNNDADAVLFSGTVSGTTLTVEQLVSGTIAIGQTIADNFGLVTVGTKITAGSGTSWTLSNSMAIPGASFTGTGSGTTLTAASVSGTITAGMILTGAGVPAGTSIIAQLTGTPGGAGNYQTSGATTSSGASLAAAVAIHAASANQDTCTVHIDQIPTVSAAEVTLTLV